MARKRGLAGSKSNPSKSTASRLSEKSNKSAKSTSRSQTKSTSANSQPSQTQMEKMLQRIEAQQQVILMNQRKQMSEIKESEEKIEEDIMEAETSLPGMNEEKEIEEIKRLEDDIKKGTVTSPLRRITYRDVTKGLVGAFIAVVNQFAFANGFQIAEHYSIFQSSLLFITSFFIIVLFIYYTGFRKVDDKFVFRFLPIRAGILYIVSIFVSTIVPFVFNTLTPSMPFSVIYGTIASISVLAVLGAGTADLIGKA